MPCARWCSHYIIVSYSIFHKDRASSRSSRWCSMRLIFSSLSAKMCVRLRWLSWSSYIAECTPAPHPCVLTWTERGPADAFLCGAPSVFLSAGELLLACCWRWDEGCTRVCVCVGGGSVLPTDWQPRSAFAPFSLEPTVVLLVPACRGIISSPLCRRAGWNSALGVGGWGHVKCLLPAIKQECLSFLFLNYYYYILKMYNHFICVTWAVRSAAFPISTRLLMSSRWGGKKGKRAPTLRPC